MTTLDTRDQLPIVLNGVHYQVDLSAMRRQTIDATRNQFDQAGDVGEQSLSSQYLWKRSGDLFDFGAGQQNFDMQETDSRRRFYRSVNINPWDDSGIQLQHKLRQSLTPLQVGGVDTVSGGSWLVNLGSNLYLFRNGVVSSANTNTNYFRIDRVIISLPPPYTKWTAAKLFESGGSYAAGSTYLSSSSTAFNPAATDYIKHLVHDGNAVYITFGNYNSGTGAHTVVNQVYKFVLGSDDKFTMSKIGSSSDTYTNLLLAGSRLLARHVQAGTPELVELTASGHKTAIATYPVFSEPIFSSAISGPDGIYFAHTVGDRSRRSVISRAGFEEATGNILPPAEVLRLPDGELINRLFYYSSFVLLGTTRGVRVAEFTATGGLTYGPLLGSNVDRGDGGVTNFFAEKNFIYFNDQLTDGSTYWHGLGRIDLGQLVNQLEPAWSSDIMFSTADVNEKVESIGKFLNVIGFSTYKSGSYTEDPDSYATEGWIESGYINFSVTERKRYIDLTIQGVLNDNETIDVDFATYDFAELDTDSYTISPTGTAPTGTRTIRDAHVFDNLYGERSTIRLTLNSSSYTASGYIYGYSPTISRWVLRSTPIAERQEEIWLPIILKDSVTYNGSFTVGLDPYDEFAALRALMQSRLVVDLTIGSETRQVVVDAIITGLDQSAQVDRWNRDKSWPEAIWYLRCITMPDGTVTPVPTVVNNLVGPVGPQGPQGTTGATGPTGPQGSIGATGATGLQGPTGSQGPTGPQGSVGPQGSIGATGPQGAVGSQGPTGPQGAVGAQGSVGPQGSIGPTGPQGPQGSTGANSTVAGPTGPAGPQGSAGPQGTVGAQGPTGPQGAVGAQGATGPQGVTGSTGPQGATGATGPQGAAGSNARTLNTVSTSSYTIAATDKTKIIWVTASSCTVNVPDDLSLSVGDTFIIMNATAGTAAIDIYGLDSPIGSGVQINNTSLFSQYYCSQKKFYGSQIFIECVAANTYVLWGDYYGAGFPTATPACRVYNSANISHTTSGTAQALTFDSERFDRLAMHSTSSNTSRITIPTGWGGIYQIGASVAFTANATGYRQISIKVNGSTDIVFQNAPTTGSAINHRLSAQTIYYLNAGDYIEVYANQTSGGALNILAQGNHTPEFYAQWIAP